MEKAQREEIIIKVRGLMSKTKPLTAAEIHQKLFPNTELFAGEDNDYTVAQIEEALRDESNDPFGSVSQSNKKKSRKRTFLLKRERTIKPGKPATDTDSTKQIGTGGEYLVLSELLFAGYEANIMSVDDGIDIVASKNNKIYFIQVKTTYAKNNRVSVQIPIDSFERVKEHDVRYFIVIREGYGSARILMLHQHDIITFSANGYIDKSDANYNIKIEFRNDGIPMLYNGHGDSMRVQSAMQEEHKFRL